MEADRIVPEICRADVPRVKPHPQNSLPKGRLFEIDFLLKKRGTGPSANGIIALR